MADRARLTTYILAALAAILRGTNLNLAKPVLAVWPPLGAGVDRYLMRRRSWRRPRPVSTHSSRPYLKRGTVGYIAPADSFYLEREVPLRVSRF